MTPQGERLDRDFLGLAELLTVVVGRSGVAGEELRQIGREWGRYVVGRPGRYDAAERIPAVLGRLGFDLRRPPDRCGRSRCAVQVRVHRLG
jgi:hypothetical protein